MPFVVRAHLDDNLGRSLAQSRRERVERRLRWLTDRIFGEHLTPRISFDRDGRVLTGVEMAALAVGTLEIEFDTRLLAQDFLSRSGMSIVTGMARTILLGIVLAVVTHLMITRPLERVVAAVEAIDPEAPTRLPVPIGPSHERDELGRLARTIDALLDRVASALTQRREAFDRLAASEARYRAVVDTQNEFIARIRPDGRLSFVSDAYCRYFGRARAELLGRGFNEFTHTVPEDRERDAARLATLSPDCPSSTIELRRQLPDGGVRWVQWSDTALFDGEGWLVEVQSVGRDVTERVEVEAALRASEARFVAAAESIPDGLIILDQEDRIVFYNNRHRELVPPALRGALRVGLRFEDWIRDSLARGPVYHADMGPDYASRRLATRGEASTEREHKHADGRWVRVREGRMPDGGRVLLTVDVTAQREAEAALRASEARFVAAAETLPDGLAIFDAEDRLVFHNSRYPEHQTPNLRQALALGKRFEDWLRDGIAIGPIYDPEMGEDFLARRLALRQLDQSDHEQHIADGRWVRIREARMPDGGRVLLSSDITLQRQLEVDLRQAEKLKAVGTLASGIAHDFNNVLATIFAATEVALVQLPADAPARATLERVISAGKRGRDLASQVLTFGRTERSPRLGIDLGATIEAVADLCRPTLGPQVELTVEGPVDPVFVAADETQIHQLVTNLCLNAAQAMPGHGRIVIGVEGVESPDDPGWAILRVHDTGSGMDDETAARVFEPFFTTKPVGQGTGLGLAVVHGIVKALGGRIQLKTAPSHGSTFRITLPRVHRPGAAALPSRAVAPSGGGGPVVHVAPDDEVAEAIGVILRGAGYRVTRFVDPSDALEHLAATPHRDGLLIAELTLPGLSGPELAEAARAVAPGLGVILLADAAATLEQAGGGCRSVHPAQAGPAPRAGRCPCPAASARGLSM